MASHRHENGQDGCRQQPPFFPPFVQAQAQHKKEDGDGAHIHGTGGERLRAPVQGQRLGGFPHILLPGLPKELHRGRFIRIHSAGRGTAVEIGNHEVGKFFPAVTPRCGISQVQTVSAGAAVLGQFGAAAHGVRRVFGQRQQLVHIGGNAHAANHQQQGRCHQERLPGLVLNGADEFHQRIQQNDNGQIIRHLLMVGFDLETESQAEKGSAQEGLREIPGQAGYDGRRAGHGLRHGRLRSAISCRTVSVHHRRQYPGH